MVDKKTKKNRFQRETQDDGDERLPPYFSAEEPEIKSASNPAKLRRVRLRPQNKFDQMQLIVMTTVWHSTEAGANIMIVTSLSLTRRDTFGRVAVGKTTEHIELVSERRDPTWGLKPRRESKKVVLKLYLRSFSVCYLK